MVRCVPLPVIVGSAQVRAGDDLGDLGKFGGATGESAGSGPCFAVRKSICDFAKSNANEMRPVACHPPALRGAAADMKPVTKFLFG